MAWWERARNALRGFGPVTDTERENQIARADTYMPMVVGTNFVSMWGVGKIPVDPDGEGRL